MRKADYSNRDRNAGAAIVGILVWKKGLPPELCSHYYRDVHGMVGARTLGLAHYFQHHVDRCHGGFWTRLSGIEYDCSEEDQIDAVSEPTFTSEEDQQKGARSIAFRALWEDEQNFLEKSFLYSTKPGSSKTHVDGIENGVLNGMYDFVKLIVWVKKRNEVDIDAFRDYMSNAFAPSIVKSNFVLKLRLHLLEEYNAAMWNPNVIHDRTPEQQYQACFEIGFLDRFEMRRFFTSAEYAATTQDQLKHAHPNYSCVSRTGDIYACSRSQANPCWTAKLPCGRDNSHSWCRKSD